jgi:lincosamide and streptogramin A transport system ATP-binding/permease protein
MARAKAIETRREAAIEEKEKLLKNIEHQASLKLSQAAYHKERLLEVRDLTVNYGNGKLFTPLSFELLRGDRLALLGRNGSGKSSILKLLCGGVIPYSGSLEKGSGLTISYVPQDPGDLCGDLADYARRFAIDESLFKAILIKLDFARKQFEKDMADFSAGQKKKVLIARSLCEKSHLHIWDEPMNYIDVISRMQIEELILEHRPTLIFVEHDRAFCGKVATKSLELKR